MFLKVIAQKMTYFSLNTHRASHINKSIFFSANLLPMEYFISENKCIYSTAFVFRHADEANMQAFCGL